ncbi:M67 family metallopeptidase [Brevibacillus migulae]|uniref:M67 family metallopeptidase n=1 Tax=Brevibacillus migulae TaxID=1644114 RepID=UPI00106E6F62|nr:M67 family metallopeptidase [Brevibacillus migulae]
MFPHLIGTPFSQSDHPLTLHGQVQKRLFTAGKEALPHEYSALLAGNGATISHLFDNPSAFRERHRFAWEGPPFLHALRSIKEADLEWLGVVHTHPLTPPVPSPSDLAGWHYPTLSYWILSLADPTQPSLVLYQWEQGRFIERPYVIG